MAYSVDYRRAAIEFKQSGHTFVELKAAFKITARTYYQWLELLEETGSYCHLDMEAKRQIGERLNDKFKNFGCV